MPWAIFVNPTKSVNITEISGNVLGLDIPVALDRRSHSQQHILEERIGFRSLLFNSVRKRIRFSKSFK